MPSSYHFINDRKFFLTLVCLSFFVFVISSDAHRFTFDEDVTQQQSMWLATMTPHPDFVPGESRQLFQYPEYFPNNQRPICNIGILCSQVPIGNALTQVPFILLNHNFEFITSDTITFTEQDFPDPHYVYWRNSLNPDFTFLELFYGPVFASLAVGMFYLVARTYEFTPKLSSFLSVLFAVSTTLWAYSQTSLNIIPITFFILFGFYLFRKFVINHQSRYILFSGIVFGFSFIVRNDAILFIIPLFFFCIYDSFKNYKIQISIQNILLFSIPMISFYFLQYQIRELAIQQTSSGIPSVFVQQTPLFLNMFGMLFSPGVGLLVFSPVLFTVFLSYFDFFKKNKPECILFVSFIVAFLVFYAQSDTWHGLNGWGERYLTAVVPFLLLPLGFTIQKRASKKLIAAIIGLGSLGVLFNISYLLTDVSWFIWGIMGSGRGLYELGHITTSLWVHPLVLWTFEYSQLTHAIKYAMISMHPDIFLLKLWGQLTYGIFSAVSIGLLSYYLIHLNKQYLPEIRKQL